MRFKHRNKCHNQGSHNPVTGTGIVSDILNGKYNYWIVAALGLYVAYRVGVKVGVSSTKTKLAQAAAKVAVLPAVMPQQVAQMQGMQGLGDGRDAMGFAPVDTYCGGQNSATCAPRNNIPSNVPSPSDDFELFTGE